MRSFVIRQDNQPVKVISLEPRSVQSFMQRLGARFPKFRWSICERFLPGGGD